MQSRGPQLFPVGVETTMSHNVIVFSTMGERVTVSSGGGALHHNFVHLESVRVCVSHLSGVGPQNLGEKHQSITDMNEAKVKF